MIAGYVQSGAYSIASMEKRESEIREKAEDVVHSSLRAPKRMFYNWVLFHARKGMYGQLCDLIKCILLQESNTEKTWDLLVLRSGE